LFWEIFIQEHVVLYKSYLFFITVSTRNPLWRNQELAAPWKKAVAFLFSTIAEFSSRNEMNPMKARLT
jgi:hypothetical protein